MLPVFAFFDIVLDMFPASWLSEVGLTLDFIGVLFLYYNGLPPRMEKPNASSISFNAARSEEEKALFEIDIVKFDNISMWSRIGLLLLLGTSDR